MYRVRSRSPSYRSTRSHQSPSLTSSSGSERSLGGSGAHSPGAYGYRAMRSHSRRSRRDGSPNYRSRRGQRSRSSRRSHCRHHGSRSYGRDRSRSYSRSNHSRSMSRESRSRHVDNPISQATRSSEFSGYPGSPCTTWPRNTTGHAEFNLTAFG